MSSDRPLPRYVARPLRDFLRTEAAGGIVLLVATVAALVWVNSPVGHTYEALWHTEVSFSVGGFELEEDLRHWINDALMTLFFFVVGLEIKRELVVGELNDVRKAALPAIAALGGMVVPAALYASLNAGGPGAAGWGIPMATDIAFAVGVLALLGSRVPQSLKVFLLSLAIVDDIGAIAVIAIFYSSGIQSSWLLVAAVFLLAIAALRRLSVYWVPAYVVLGTVVWLATFESGVHATIAGVILGLMAPARPADPRGVADVFDRASALRSEPHPEAVRALALQAQEVVSVAERLEHTLHPWTSYVVIPLFAFANAGLVLSSEALRAAVSSPVTIGILAGLVLGKIVGVAGTSWLAIKLNLGQAPPGVGTRELIGAGALAGIGFTVSLFITGLAFSDPGLADAARMGILGASLVAGACGAAVLARSAR